MRCRRVWSCLRDTPNSRAQAGRRLAFGHPTQQQHQRGRSLPRLFEDRPRQQRVVAIAGPAAVGWEMPLCTEQAPLGTATVGACEPLRMQVTLQPDQADADRPAVRQSESRSCVYDITLRTVATHEPRYLLSCCSGSNRVVNRYLSPTEQQHYIYLGGDSALSRAQAFFDTHHVQSAYIFFARDWQRRQENAIRSHFELYPIQSFPGVHLMQIFRK